MQGFLRAYLLASTIFWICIHMCTHIRFI